MGDIPDTDYYLLCDPEPGYWSCAYIDGDYYPVYFWKDTDGSVGIWGLENMKNKIRAGHDGFAYFANALIAARQARFEHGETPPGRLSP